LISPYDVSYPALFFERAILPDQAAPPQTVQRLSQFVSQQSFGVIRLGGGERHLITERGVFPFGEIEGLAAQGQVAVQVFDQGLIWSLSHGAGDAEEVAGMGISR